MGKRSLYCKFRTSKVSQPLYHRYQRCKPLVQSIPDRTSRRGQSKAKAEPSHIQANALPQSHSSNCTSAWWAWLNLMKLSHGQSWTINRRTGVHDHSTSTQTFPQVSIQDTNNQRISSSFLWTKNIQSDSEDAGITGIIWII